MQTATDSRCLSGKRCVSRTSDGAALTARADTLCPGCIKDIQRCLDELPTYLLALGAFLGATPKTALQSKVSMTSEPSSPYNVKVADLIDDVDEVVRRDGGMPVRDLVTQPVTRFDDRWLSGVDRALEIRKMHGRADAIVGLGRVWERRHAPCPDCGLRTLGQWSGDDQIFCTNNDCSTSLSKDEYEQWCELGA